MAMEVDHFEEVKDLYRSGLYLTAYRIVRDNWGEPRNWTTTPQRVLGGRLAGNLGSPRLGLLLHRLAFRATPDVPEARYYGTFAIAHMRGWLAAWRLLRQCDELPNGTSDDQANWLTLKADAAAKFRDFDMAERCLAKAEAVAEPRPWFFVTRASVCEAADEVDAAIEAARESLKRQPYFRPGVQVLAHLLDITGKDDESLDLLTRASEAIECGPLFMQRASIEREMERFDDAQRSLERSIDLCPLADSTTTDWFNLQHSQLSYLRGDYEAALTYVRRCDPKRCEKQIQRMESMGEDRTRKQLDVRFVRQHYRTCGPATLTAIAGFWGKPADHLEVAEEICYGGTPAHSERHWAEANGYEVREFRVTWDTTVQLIDRGIPFTLTTTAPGNGHLQAAIGYDKGRRLLLVRDSTHRETLQYCVDEMIECQLSTGPRGMALVPIEEAHRYDGVEWPDRSLYDAFYAMQMALRTHDRTRAQKHLDAMREQDPDHRLTHWAAMALGDYDADHPRQLGATEALLKQYPNDVNLRLRQLELLRQTARHSDRMAILEAQCRKDEPDPIFLAYLGHELSEDAAQHDRASDLLHRALRYRPDQGNLYHSLADIYWSGHRRDEALELYRFAAGIDDTHEGHMLALFAASRHCKRTEEAMNYLRGRFDRFGDSACHPAITLHNALLALDRTREGFDILSEAIARRPDDGELLLFASGAFARFGEYGKASDLLKRAQDKAPRHQVLRSAANLANIRGQLTHALKLWRKVLETEPLAIDAHRAITILLAETSSQEAAVEHLAGACRRFPHSIAIHEAHVHWLRVRQLPGAEEQLKVLLSLHPNNAWARRELAATLAAQHRYAEALDELGHARTLEPTSPAYYNVLGGIHAERGDLSRAREAYREAIKLNADEDCAIRGLLANCENHARQCEELQFVEHQLIRQVIFGDGLLTYHDVARDVLDPKALLASLRSAHQSRRDLWATWSVLVRQLADMDRLDEAVTIAGEAIERFPLLPRLWLDLADVRRRQANDREELIALRRALRISPDYSDAVIQLANLYHRRGKKPRRIAVIERASKRNPLEVSLHGELAEAYWDSKMHDKAIARMRRALELHPGIDWAWGRLQVWATEAGKPTLALDLARQRTEKHGDQPQTWLILARLLDGFDQLDERLAALDTAIRLDPRFVEAHDFKARLLTDYQRFDQALAACRPAVFGENPPVALRARSAWVDAMRGRLDDAIRAMRRLLDEEPQFHYGWLQLMDWFEYKEDNRRFLEAAGRMVELLPNDARALTLRAEGRLRQNDTEGARVDLERAVTLAPDYFRGVWGLIGLYMNAHEGHQVDQLITRLKHHLGPAVIASVRAHLAADVNDRTQALKHFERLVLAEDAEHFMIDNPIQAVINNGWQNDLEAMLRRVTQTGDAPMLAYELLGHVLQKKGDWRAFEAPLKQLEAAGRDDVWQDMVGAFIDGAAEAGMWKVLQPWIKQNERRLFHFEHTWGRVAYAYLLKGEYRKLIQWMKDWRQRRDVTPVSLIYLAMALRETGNDAGAAQVSLAALNQSPDHATGGHELLLALDDALAGNPTAAAARAERIDEAALVPAFQYRFMLLRAVLTAQLQVHQFGQAAIDQAKQQIKEAKATREGAATDKYLQQLTKRAIKAIAAARPSLVPFPLKEFRDCKC